MFKPKLRISEQVILDDDYQGIMPEVLSIQNWLNKRDPSDRAGLLKTLTELNRVQCDPDLRLTLMKIMDKEIHKELEYLYRKTELVSFPVAEEYQSLIDIMQHLLLESSVAYQIVVNDIANNKDYLNQYLGNILPEALYMALQYISRLLVERSEFYLSEPPYIWQELNQLYLLAERIGAQNEVMHSRRSIKDIYLKIVILKLLDPYRLMRLESRKIHLLLDKWVEHSHLKGFAGQNPEHHHVVDLLSDSPPHCFDPDKDKAPPGQEYEGRIIDLEPLCIFIDEYLQRIRDELKVYKDRTEERVLSGNEIRLVSGLTACHHFINNRKPFELQREIHQWQEENLAAVQAEEKDDSEINLINLLEEERLLNKKNPMGELQSINPFMSEVNIMGDEWDKIYTSSVVQADIFESQQQFSENLQEQVWKQRNESKHGMLLVGRNDIEMPIAVGMLVAYRLASVKWLRIKPHKGMAIGIHLIAVIPEQLPLKQKKG